MRTYFIIAALMGIFAFGSISILAHAQDAGTSKRIAAPVAEDMEEPPAAEDEPPAEEVEQEEPEPVDSPETAAQDRSKCLQSANERKGPTRRKPSPEDSKVAFESCMSNLGYTAEEIGGNEAE
ncbi:MAG: hypothetical protein ACAH80_16720 [Alphaproteobacteria bacterium]